VAFYVTAVVAAFAIARFAPGLLVVGVALRRLWLVALGAVGVILVVPETAARYLPHSIARPLAIFAAGLVLVGVALWLAKTRRAPKSR
jgi:hypothetical protein